MHGYSMRESYRFITHSDDTVDKSLVDDVWHRDIPLKVSMLAWRLHCNRLTTKGNLLRRGGLLSTYITCAAAGCDSTKTSPHLFLHCDTSRELWSKVLNWIGIYLVAPDHLRHHFIQFTTMTALPRSSHLFFRTIWFATVWVIWKEMNYRIFQNTASTSMALIEKVKLNLLL